MDAQSFLEIKQRIACGEFACLQECCKSGSLQAIWSLMRAIGQSDLPALERMLCGCAYNPASPKTTGGSPEGAGPLAGPAVSCSDKALDWACAHRSSLEAARTVLTVAGLMPALTPMAIAMGLLIQDILNACSEEGRRLARGSKVMDQIVARLCTLRASLKLLALVPMDSVTGAAIQAFVTVMTPIMDLMGPCCSGFTASDSPSSWPAIPGTSSSSPPALPPATGSSTVLTSTSGSTPVIVAPPVKQNPYD